MPYEKNIADLVQKQLFLEPKWCKNGQIKTALAAKPADFSWNGYEFRANQGASNNFCDKKNLGLTP